MASEMGVPPGRAVAPKRGPAEPLRGAGATLATLGASPGGSVLRVLQIESACRAFQRHDSLSLLP